VRNEDIRQKSGGRLTVEKLKRIADLSNDFKIRTPAETIAFKKAKSWDCVRQHWWYALIFFFDRAFYQGRNDVLSGDFEQATLAALDKVLGSLPSNDKLLRLKQLSHWVQPDQWKAAKNPLCEALSEKYSIGGKQRGTGRERDKEMVMDTLRFVSSECKDCNILEHSIEQIKNHRIAELFKRLDGITSVGEKIASFFLRDTVFFYDLERYVGPDDYRYLVPIDARVRKVTDKLGIKANAQAIAEICRQNEISPVRLAIGLWYVDSHSLDLLLDRL